MRIAEKLYRKVQHGKSVRYEEVAESELMVPYTHGFYLCHVKQYSTQIRRIVDPDSSAVEAAMLLAGNAMVEAMLQASRPRMETRHLTDAERAIVTRVTEELGYMPSVLYSSESLQGVVEAGMKALREHMANTGEL